ncbi:MULTISPECIES: spore germination lipoprotein GerD [Sporosarcina]|uniref:spore germination lipoprotein GerD n=1 Tax=Sporosarcina TaxID=1569 RepID=UPI00129B153F|nr:MULTISPECIES: spore germination lipoprotein GerD [Sporosarcina]GKV65386.1 spore germination protein GerD [Sporosarcina sp. NCCP-2331]GLB55510.1 spore germination protein GerD [Sporosarcina sp. NCCP-2378]
MKKIAGLLLFLVFLTGCSGGQQAGPSYDEMKKMMTDAIQTEDGKKALRKLMTDPEFRELLVLEQPEVKQSIENVLLSKEGENFWKTAFEDPKFTESVAKSMKKQQADIMKDLMGDASFQKEMEKFFGQPDMMKQMEKVINSSTLKKEMEKAVEDTINSPLMQAKWQQLIMKAGKGSEAEGEDKGGKEESGEEEEKAGGGK